MRNDFESNYLAHHGILGQKWGVRRYQNPDGSLTEAGRKRYGVAEGGSVNDISSAQGQKRRIKDLKKAVKLNEKKRSKEYTKIVNNPENFLGLNKRHAKKISEYSDNIKKGQAEIDDLLKKASKVETEEKGISKYNSTNEMFADLKRQRESQPPKTNQEKLKDVEQRIKDSNWKEYKDGTWGWKGDPNASEGTKDHDFDAFMNILDERRELKEKIKKK